MNQNPITTLPIVGAFYRPPAELLLSVLPIETELLLIAEPENLHDPNAIAVWLESLNIPSSAYPKLEIELPNFGLNLDSLLASDYWHLGYIPRAFALKLREAGIVDETGPKPVTFCLSPDGKPRVRFSNPISV